MRVCQQDQPKTNAQLETCIAIARKRRGPSSSHRISAPPKGKRRAAKKGGRDTPRRNDESEHLSLFFHPTSSHDDRGLESFSPLCQRNERRLGEKRVFPLVRPLMRFPPPFGEENKTEVEEKEERPEKRKRRERRDMFHPTRPSLRGANSFSAAIGKANVVFFSVGFCFGPCVEVKASVARASIRRAERALFFRDYWGYPV